MLKRLLFTVWAAVSVTVASAQVKVNIDIDPNEPITSDIPVKIANNGRVVTQKGLALLHFKDLNSVNVSAKRDTMTLTLKPDALKLLDANEKVNYEPASKSGKSGKKSAVKK